MKRNDRREPCPGRAEAIEAMASGMEADPTLREHLLECPACNGYYRRQRRLDELLHGTAGALEDPWLAARPRERRVSAWRIAAVSGTMAASIAIVVAVVAIADTRSTATDDGGDAPVIAKSQGGTSAVDDIELAQIVDEEPDVVLEQTHLTTTGTEHVVRSFEGGLRLSLSGEGDALVQRTAKRSYRIKLQSGLLVGDVPDAEPRTRVTISAENMVVKIKGTLFSVRAVDGRITSVDVERGQVLVQSKVSGESRLVNASERLEVESLALDDRPQDSPSMLMSFLVEIPVDDEEELEVIGPSKPVTGTTHAKIASATGADQSQELTLYDQAVALRKAGKYEEAVDTFLAAAAVTAGLTQQRCYYQAASLSLTELGDPARTITLCDSYASKFPQGFFIEDVIMLEARAHLRAKAPEKARAVLVDYIASYPDGSQQSLAHLLLGKIFATTYDNCKAAESHLLYVVQSEPKSTRATQAQKILDYCSN